MIFRQTAVRATLLVGFAVGTACSASAAPRDARSAPEAAFLRSVDRHNTENVVTGDLVHYTGTHVAYTCDVDSMVRPGTILGRCGSAQEPLDLFIHLRTTHLHVGEHLRVLGIMEPPAMWTDVTGHTIYYAFLKAIYFDTLK